MGKGQKRGVERCRAPGFTLIEMLVVMAIISILASMLLPSIARGKERGREAQCLNNLRQIGMGIKMYWDDNDLRMDWVSGGHEALPGCLSTNHLPARERRLHPYLGRSEIFRCWVDQGKISEDCPQHPETRLKPSCWGTRGFSYEFNIGYVRGLSSPFTKFPVAGTIIGKTEAWIPNPSKFILMYEPPAVPQVCGHMVEHFRPRWYQWHRRRVGTEFLDSRLAPGLFYSPVLFHDGHVAIHNFTKALTTDPYYFQEETKEWMWYKPATH